MIQDIAPYKFFNAYHHELPLRDSIILYFDEQQVLAAEVNGEILFPVYSDWKDQNTEFTYLFSINDTKYFLANTVLDYIPEGYGMINIKVFRTAHPRHTAFAGITAFQLNNWYLSHRFCGKCGSKMVHDKKERMLYCENCHQTEYPKISPAVIIAVTDGDRILMSRYAHGTYKKYALLAGFTEIGETAEQTVEREVMEEVGLHVKNIRYYKSQPWSFSDTLLMGFYAELEGDDIIKLDKEELSEAVWINKEKIEVKPDNLSLTNEMITRFKKG